MVIIGPAFVLVQMTDHATFKTWKIKRRGLL